MSEFSCKSIEGVGIGFRFQLVISPGVARRWGWEDGNTYSQHTIRALGIRGLNFAQHDAPLPYGKVCMDHSHPSWLLRALPR